MATPAEMLQDDPLIVLLNGPLGVGKSTLGEALGEAIERSVVLDGDRLSALNPPPVDEVACLHATLALLIGHHLSQGYRRFVINHFWRDPIEIADLEAQLKAVAQSVRIRCYRLFVSEEENLRRMALRQSVRAIDETEFEMVHFAEEYALLCRAKGAQLGMPFDASDSPEVLASRMLALLELPERL